MGRKKALEREQRLHTRQRLAEQGSLGKLTPRKAHRFAVSEREYQRYLDIHELVFAESIEELNRIRGMQKKTVEQITDITPEISKPHHAQQDFEKPNNTETSAESELYIPNESDRAKAEKFLAEEQKHVKDIVEISPMDSGALRSKEVIGSIDPPTQAMFVTGIKVPTVHGFRIIKPTKHIAKQAETVEEDDQDIAMNGLIRVTVPITKSSTMIPSPGGHIMSGCSEEDGLMVAQPSPESPFGITNLDAADGGEISYSLRPLPRPLQAEAKFFSPSEEEQAFWRTVLPIPQKLLEACHKDPASIPQMVGYFIKQNFQYLCHTALGSFIQDHPEDMVLILEELKVGHCDLLSWLTSAYLRMFGVPAVVTNNLVPNIEANRFMKHYGHARIAYISPENTIIYFDPSLHCENITNKVSFHDSHVEMLEEHFDSALTLEQKRHILREFHRQFFIPEVITKAPETQVFTAASIDSLSLSSGIFNIPLRPSPKHLSEQTMLPVDFEQIIPFEDIRVIAEKFHIRYLLASRCFLDIACFEKSESADRSDLQALLRSNEYYGIMFGEIDALYSRDDNSLISLHFGAYTQNLRRFPLTPHKTDQPLQKADMVIKDINNYFSFSENQLRNTHLENLDFISDQFQFSASFFNYTRIFFERIQMPDGFKVYSGIDDDITKKLDGNKRSKKNPRLVYYECQIFILLVLKSFKNPALRNRLKKEFNLDDGFFTCFASNVLKENTPEKIKRRYIRMKKLPSNLSQEEKDHLQEFSRWRSIFKIDQQKVQMGAMKFAHFLTSLSLRVSFGKANEDDLFDYELEPYDPGKHQVEDIQWAVSNRTGKLVAKNTPQIAPRKELRVHLNLQAENCFIGNWGKLSMILRGIQLFCRNTHTHVTLTSDTSDIGIIIDDNTEAFDVVRAAYNVLCAQKYSSNEYRKKIMDQRAMPVDLLAKIMDQRAMPVDLLTNRNNNTLVDKADVYKEIMDQTGMPANLLYINYGDGALVCAKELFSKKTNFIGKTYEELGLEMFPTLTDEYVKGIN